MKASEILGTRREPRVVASRSRSPQQFELPVTTRNSNGTLAPESEKLSSVSVYRPSPSRTVREVLCFVSLYITLVFSVVVLEGGIEELSLATALPTLGVHYFLCLWSFRNPSTAGTAALILYGVDLVMNLIEWLSGMHAFNAITPIYLLVYFQLLLAVYGLRARR